MDTDTLESILVGVKAQQHQQDPGKGRPQSEQSLKCPRCDSPNTKFCYYNNYSLSQPRYFCKSCRRYWTKGGTLRNIPVGGGCRKNKRVSSTKRKQDLHLGGLVDSLELSDLTLAFRRFQKQDPSMGLLDSVTKGSLEHDGKILVEGEYDHMVAMKRELSSGENVLLGFPWQVNVNGNGTNGLLSSPPPPSPSSLVSWNSGLSSSSWHHGLLNTFN